MVCESECVCMGVGVGECGCVYGWVLLQQARAGVDEEDRGPRHLRGALEQDAQHS
jgi:hypothetical protein